jgi:transcription termination/antitermination protein NusG
MGYAKQRVGSAVCDRESGAVSTIQPLVDLTSTMRPLAHACADQHWYAVHTRARHERVVAALLQQKAVTTFLPLLFQVHRWSDRKKVVEVPLFPGYTFVRIGTTPRDFVEVLQTTGVVGLVGNGRGGVSIPDKQIEDIQVLLSQRVPCATSSFLRVGQHIRIRGGCLDGVEGRLIMFKGDRTLIISLEPIFRSLAVRLDGYDVEILSAGDAVT